MKIFTLKVNWLNRATACLCPVFLLKVARYVNDDRSLHIFSELSVLFLRVYILRIGDAELLYLLPVCVRLGLFYRISSSYSKVIRFKGTRWLYCYSSFLDLNYVSSAQV